MSNGKNKPKYKKFDIQLTEGPLTLYASPSILQAVDEVNLSLNLYKGVKLAQVLKAVYEQGRKDGRREVIEDFDLIKRKRKYLPPGRPKES